MRGNLALPYSAGGALLTGLSLVFASAHIGGQGGYTLIADSVMARVHGATTTQEQLENPGVACARTTFPPGTIVDCTGFSNGTPCGFCGARFARWAVKTGTTGGPGADPTGGVLPCRQANEVVGACQGGVCVGVAGANRCVGANIKAYLEEP